MQFRQRTEHTPTVLDLWLPRVLRLMPRDETQRSRPRVYGGTGASVEPVGAAKAEQYAKHPHPSTAEVRGNVVAQAALRHLQRDVASPCCSTAHVGICWSI